MLEAHPAAPVDRINFYGWGPVCRSSFSDVIIHALRNTEQLILFNVVTYIPTPMEVLITTTHGLVDQKASGVFHVAATIALRTSSAFVLLERSG